MMRWMKSLIGLGLAVTSVVVFASPARADFGGPYDVGNWNTTLTGSPPGGGGIVDTSGAPASIEIVGGDLACSGLPCTVDFTIAAVASGLVSFDWAYETTDDDGPFYDHFGFLLNGFFTQLSDDNGGNSQSGSGAFAVSLDDVFGFRLDCTDCGSGRPLSRFQTSAHLSMLLLLLLWCLSHPRCSCWAPVCWRGNLRPEALGPQAELKHSRPSLRSTGRGASTPRSVYF